MPIRQVVLRSNVLINILTDFLEMGRFTFVDIKNMLWRMKMSLMGRFFPKKLIDYRFHDVYGRFINWNSPQTLDEKINSSDISSNISRRLSVGSAVTRCRKYSSVSPTFSPLIPSFIRLLPPILRSEILYGSPFSEISRSIFSALSTSVPK